MIYSKDIHFLNVPSPIIFIEFGRFTIKPDISYLYNEIITKANPKMFIEPYQPNKLATANEIYSEALKNKHNRDVLKKLLDRIKKEL